VQRVTNWLESHGFKVNVVYTGGMVIDFSGNAGQVREAFHTEIHNLEVRGKHHIGNMSEPKIPAALAGVIKGVSSLHDFMPHSMMKKRTDFTFTCVPVTIGGQTYPCPTTVYTAVVPADLATIYNLNPAFAAGYTGAGQTIVVIEDTNIKNTSDWSTFRTAFGLSSYTSGSFTQEHPSGSNTCTSPGENTAEAEAALDAEWASAAAPNAAIVLASCWHPVPTAQPRSAACSPCRTLSMAPILRRS
jgi:subtilase family serine protease